MIEAVARCVSVRSTIVTAESPTNASGTSDHAGRAIVGGTNTPRAGGHVKLRYGGAP